MVKQIPKINFKLLCNGNRSSIEEKVEFDNLKIALQKYGFLIIENHSVAYEEIKNVFALYRAFFNQSVADKYRVDMSQTSSNRGWGPTKSERVNPDFQPDTKEVFDCGPNINIRHDFEYSPYYAKNIWPENIPLLGKQSRDFTTHVRNSPWKSLNKLKMHSVSPTITLRINSTFQWPY